MKARAYLLVELFGTLLFAFSLLTQQHIVGSWEREKLRTGLEDVSSKIQGVRSTLQKLNQNFEPMKDEPEARKLSPEEEEAIARAIIQGGIEGMNIAGQAIGELIDDSVNSLAISVFSVVDLVLGVTGVLMMVFGRAKARKQEIARTASSAPYPT
jgi:hypothetical protein